jgi:hypothetical protein
MPQASFVHASQTITFTLSPLRPQWSLDRIQPREQTAADVPIVHDSLAVDDLMTLVLRLTDSNRSELEWFFTNVARGMSNAFTYNDTSGTARTVKFHQPTLNPREIAYNSHTVTVTMRVQP